MRFVVFEGQRLACGYQAADVISSSLRFSGIGLQWHAPAKNPSPLYYL